MLIELAENKNIPYNLIKINNENLINYAKTQLDNKGILHCTKKEPYCYLKISDDFIHKLYPFLPKMGVAIPNYFNFAGAVGAHISVIYNQEMQQEILINELGNTISFTPENLYCIEVFNKRLVVLIVHALDLDSLRQKYGFPQKLNYHGLLVPFHITIATGSLGN